MPRKSPYTLKSDRSRAARTGSASPRIYVAVSRRRPGQDRADGRRGARQRRDRRPPRHPPGDRLEVAQTLLRTRPARPRRAPPRRPTPGLFPLRSSSPSRPSPASCPPASASPSPACTFPTSPPRSHPWHRGRDLGDHHLAVAVRRRHPPLAPPLLDLPPRPRLRDQGRPGPRPLRPDLAGQTAGRKRLRDLRRREDLHPGPPPLPPHPRPRRRPRHHGSSTNTTAAGALQYLAAWDVHRAKIFGRCEPKTGIEPFGRLVDQVMTSSPTPRPAGCSGWSTTAPATAAKTACDRLTPAAGPTPDPGPAARPRLLAQPSRDLQLHHPTQGPHPQRLRRPRRHRSPPRRLRTPLRANRRPLRMEVHPRRPRPAHEETRRQTRLPSRRLNPARIRDRNYGPEHLVRLRTELASQSSSS